MRINPERLMGKFATNCCVEDMWQIDTIEEAARVAEILYQQDHDEDFDWLDRIWIADSLSQALVVFNSGQSESEIESIKRKFSP